MWIVEPNERRNQLNINKNNIMKYFKDLIRTILLIVAIYSGIFAANSEGVNVIAAIICGLACSVFVSTGDDKD